MYEFENSFLILSILTWDLYFVNIFLILFNNFSARSKDCMSFLIRNYF